MRNMTFLLTTAAALLASVPAAAQSSADVVVMRRTITKATISDQEWVTGPAVAPRHCSATAVWTQQVWCERTSDKARLPDSACVRAKPPTTVVMEDRSGCSYDWASGVATYGSMCADSTTKDTPVTCNRFGTGTPVGGEVVANEAACLAVRAKPVTSERVANYSSCAYDWKTVQTTCSAGKRLVSVSCVRRAVPGVVEAGVADSYCTGAKPSEAPVADSACADKVANGGFETVNQFGSPVPWSMVNSVRLQSTYKHSGSNAIYSPYANEYVLQRLTLVAGTAYKLTAWCLRTSDFGCSAYFGASEPRNARKLATIANFSQGGIGPSNGTWTQISVTFTPTAAEVSEGYLSFMNNSGMYVDDVSLSVQ